MHLKKIYKSRKNKSELSKKDNEKKKQFRNCEKLMKKNYSVKKLSTENNELYGS